MSKKVKLSQAQADAVEYFERVFVKNKATSMSDETLRKALNDGYEVEPEFEVGDWVYREKCKTVSKITIIDYAFNVNGAIFVDAFDGWLFKDEIRHATPDEIAGEKGRRSEVKLSEILHDLTIKEKQRLRQILNS